MGITTSTEDFPVTPGAFQTTAPPVSSGVYTADAFVAKLNPSGSGLIYSTRLAGSGNDYANGVAVDAAGSAYVTGITDSSTFPVTAGAHQPASGGYIDAFLTKLNPAGSALVYSTYFGGTAADQGFAIAIDSAGDAFITGSTDSTNFPVTQGAIQNSSTGGPDAFVLKWGPSGALVVDSVCDRGHGLH